MFRAPGKLGSSLSYVRDVTAFANFTGFDNTHLSPRLDAAATEASEGCTAPWLMHNYGHPIIT